MGKREHIDDVLRNWPYVPGSVMARRVSGSDGRDVVQMRVEMGVLQMEIEGRPDGERPDGAETYFDYLLRLVMHEGEAFELTEEQCDEVDREFVQFYHRRVCWLALREFRRAQRDADHTLALMDLTSAHATDEQWILSHEQYRPFVMFHRTQAAALAQVEESGPEAAIDEIEQGLKRFQELYAQYEAEDYFDEDELVSRLVELRESIREHYEVGPTLAEELAEAIAAEEYERAAQLRDEIARKKPKQRRNV